LVLLLCAASLRGAAAGAAPEALGELPWRIGGRVGFTVDAATFPAGPDGHRLQLFIRIPPSTIDALTRGTDGAGTLHLEASLRGAGGGKDWRQDIQVGAGEQAEGLGKLAIMSFDVRPGPARLEVKLADALSRKRGIVYMGRDVPEAAEIRGVLQIPRPQAGRDLSDIEFVWSERPGTLLATGETRPSIIPNAERLYGLFEPTLRASFAARAPEGSAGAWRWIARVYDREARVIAEVDSGGPPGRLLEGSIAMDMKGLPAGGYDLEVKAWQEGDEGSATRRARFSIAWRKESWLLNPRDIEDNVHLLITSPEAEEAFVQLHPGEQERFLDDFWEKRDPDPETPGNPARESYFQRIAWANQNYSRPGLEKGMFTDRGRVFIRYGGPTEILQQVIPAGDETLRQMIRQLAYEEDRSPDHLQQPGLGGDMRPFEVWIYTGDVPLPPDAEPVVETVPRRRRLVFLFVDDQGLGHYTLRYSTE
jgi:GWxTD domain-containing protein